MTQGNASNECAGSPEPEIPKRALPRFLRTRTHFPCYFAGGKTSDPREITGKYPTGDRPIDFTAVKPDGMLRLNTPRGTIIINMRWVSSIEETSVDFSPECENDIRNALVRCHGERKAVATLLGISERTLYRKIKELGLEE